MASNHRKVRIDKFAEAIQSELKSWNGYIDQYTIREAVHQTAAETAEDVSSAAPRRKHNGGAYAESIQAGFPKANRRSYSETVHAEAPHYRLTHLLERPHRTRDGGISRAFPHWSAGDAKIKDRLIKNINNLLK